MPEKRVETRRLERIAETSECTAGERASMAQELLLLRNLAAASVRAIARAILERHPGGCCWHIVISDGNIEDNNVAYCASRADPLHVDCSTLGPLLKLLSEDQRDQVLP